MVHVIPLTFERDTAAMIVATEQRNNLIEGCAIVPTISRVRMPHHVLSQAELLCNKLKRF